MATKKTGNGPAKRKVSAPKPRGRSADAAAGAAVVKARGRVKATGQTATSSMDAASRRYKYTSGAPKRTYGGDTMSTSTLRDKVSGITRTTESFPNNLAGFKSRSSYTAKDKKTAARALKGNVRYKDYMDKLSPVGVKKKK